MRLIIFLLVVISSTIGYAQSNSESADTLTVQQFLKSCAVYREFAMEGIEGALTDFVALSDALASTSNVPEAHKQFRDLIIKAALPENHDKKSDYAPAMIRKIFSNDSLSVQIYLSWLAEHYYEVQELSFLVQSNFLEAEPPYRMSSPRALWEEIQFYNIKQGMSLADIGAGNGFLGFVLAGTEVPEHISMTEVDPDMLVYMKQRLENGGHFFESSTLSIIEAETKTTNLGEEYFDRLIMREVLHHLGQPIDVLLDCKKHLKPGGSLFLKEGTKDLPGDKYMKCNKALTYPQVLKLVKKAGFQVVKQKVIDDSWMLELKPL